MRAFSNLSFTLLQKNHESFSEEQRDGSTARCVETIKYIASFSNEHYVYVQEGIGFLWQPWWPSAETD